MFTQIATRGRAAGITAGLALSCALCPKASSDVAADTSIRWSSTPPPNDYTAVVVKDRTGGTTQIFAGYTGTALQLGGGTLDEGSDWYLANAGDSFTADTIATGKFTLIGTTFYFGPARTIPFGNFYLGVATDSIRVPGPPGRNVFGWLELYNDGTSLTPIANAVDYGDGGIIVGTTTAIPEPASLALLAGVIPLLAARRRVRRFPGAQSDRRFQQ